MLRYCGQHHFPNRNWDHQKKGAIFFDLPLAIYSILAFIKSKDDQTTAILHIINTFHQKNPETAPLSSANIPPCDTSAPSNNEIQDATMRTMNEEELLGGFESNEDNLLM